MEIVQINRFKLTVKISVQINVLIDKTYLR